MGLCENILVNKVVCDEIFCIPDYQSINISSMPIPTGSTVDGTVKVVVLDCLPTIDIIDDTINVKALLFIQKELVVKTQDCMEIPLDFGFRIEKTVKFTKCRPSDLLMINPDLLNDLECQVINASVEDFVTLHTSDPPDAFNAVFDEKLTIELKLALVQLRKLTVPICYPRNHTHRRKPSPFILPLAFLLTRTNKPF